MSESLLPRGDGFVDRFESSWVTGARGAFWGALLGLGCGLVSGAVVGTAIIPLFGSFWGAISGASTGLGVGLILGVAVAMIARTGDRDVSRIRRTTRSILALSTLLYAFVVLHSAIGAHWEHAGPIVIFAAVTLLVQGLFTLQALWASRELLQILYRAEPSDPLLLRSLDRWRIGAILAHAAAIVIAFVYALASLTLLT